MKNVNWISFLAILAFAQNLSTVEYRGLQKPLTISAQRLSPAFAALEDSYDSIQDEEIKFDDSKEVVIFSGESKLKKLSLEGLTIERHQIANSGISKIAKLTQESIGRSLKLAQLDFDGELTNGTSENIDESQTWKNKSRIDRITSAFQPKFLPQIKLAGTKSVDTFGIKNKKEINIGGTPIIIGTPIANNENITLSSSQTTKASPVSFRNLASIDSEALGRLSESESQVNISKLKGQVILAEGAVFPGDNFNFYIQRVFDGMTQERGKIDSWTGEFDITVGSPRGKLLVELRHDSGSVIAFGEVNLSKLSEEQRKQPIDLKIYPSEDIAFIGRVMSYESFDDYEVAVKETSEVALDGEYDLLQTDSEGQFESAAISAGSQVLVSASHKGFWNTIQISETGQPIHPVLHSDNRMKAFLKLLEPYMERANINSVIWGRVSHNGNPLAGSSVTLQGFEDLQALYFNLRIPDPKLTKTSTDGFFAFINPPEGLHIIKSHHAQFKIPLETTIVRSEHTSVAQMETAPKKNVNIYSYDAFNKNLNVVTSISIPGLDNAWKVGGSKASQLLFYDRPTTMVMDVDPVDSSYVSTRYFVGRRRTSLMIPNVKKSWLDSLLSQNKVNSVPRAGMMIGFIEKGKHTVKLSSQGPNTRIIYFDPKGKMVERLTNGGGFIAANIPPGVTTASILDLQTNKTLKRIALIESHRVSVTQALELN